MKTSLDKNPKMYFKSFMLKIEKLVSIIFCLNLKPERSDVILSKVKFKALAVK